MELHRVGMLVINAVNFRMNVEILAIVDVIVSVKHLSLATQNPLFSGSPLAVRTERFIAGGGRLGDNGKNFDGPRPTNSASRKV